MNRNIYDALRDLLPFVQIKNMRNTHGGVLLLVSCRLQSSTLLKVTLLHGCFSCFLNCTSGTKLHNTSHLWCNKKRLLTIKYFLQINKLVSI